MRNYEVFAKGSANYDDREASYNSDFQRRLEQMNAESSRRWAEEHLRHAKEEAFV